MMRADNKESKTERRQSSEDYEDYYIYIYYSVGYWNSQTMKLLSLPQRATEISETMWKLTIYTPSQLMKRKARRLLTRSCDSGLMKGVLSFFRAFCHSGVLSFQNGESLETRHSPDNSRAVQSSKECRSMLRVNSFLMQEDPHF